MRRIKNHIWACLKILVGKNIFEKIRAYYNIGYWPNIDSPQTFNEKLIVIKLAGDPRFVALADKIKVRNFVQERIGEQYLSKIHSIVSDITELNWDVLPNEFVIKTNNLGGNEGIAIIRDKSKINRQELEKKFKKAIKQKFGFYTNEDWYTKISPKIFTEELLTDSDKSLAKDFKLHCFNGKCRFIQVDIGRFNNHFQNYYSPTWEEQDFVMLFPKGEAIEKPKNLEEMIKISEKLSHGFHYVRVDLYSPNNRLVFGEMTFSPQSGWFPLKPKEWDSIWGSYIEL